MKFKFSPLNCSEGVSLLEAIVATFMIALAMISAFSVMKILSGGRAALDSRTVFYNASESLNNNIALMLNDVTSSDIQAFALSRRISLACGVSGDTSFQEKVQNALCQVKVPHDPAIIDVTPDYQVNLTNTYTTVGSTLLVQMRLSFFDLNSGNVLYERLFLYVK
jgi:hypothetical protein